MGREMGFDTHWNVMRSLVDAEKSLSIVHQWFGCRLEENTVGGEIRPQFALAK